MSDVALIGVDGVGEFFKWQCLSGQVKPIYEHLKQWSGDVAAGIAAR